MISKLRERYGSDAEQLVVVGHITRENIGALQEYITETSQKNPGQKFILIITTSGGDAIAASNFCIWANFWGVDLITVALGTVFSAGFTLYLSGKERLAYPDSTFFMHAISIISDKALYVENLEQQAEQIRALHFALRQIFKTRMSVSDAEIDEMLSIRGKSFTYEEARAFGLTNTVI